MRRDKIYLIGFMGAGKSTVAQQLAARLGWEAVDLDACVEAAEQQSVAQIFAQEGEAYFRQVEREVLRALGSQRNTVVATGGGTFADAANRTVIADDGVAVWLDVSFETAVTRLPSDGARPLARDPATLHTLWKERRPAYALAELRVDGEQSVDDVVSQILVWLEKDG